MMQGLGKCRQICHMQKQMWQLQCVSCCAGHISEGRERSYEHMVDARG